jgi:Patatin-like phospholipase
VEELNAAPLTSQPSTEHTPVSRSSAWRLVSYGGVSLAIYMHGVTKEIHKLVTASRGLERFPHAERFGGGARSLSIGVCSKSSRNVRRPHKVVVDIVSGTSAGGIIGVFLAKALASNLSQEAVRDIWMSRGDLRELIPYRVPTLPLKARRAGKPLTVVSTSALVPSSLRLEGGSAGVLRSRETAAAACGLVGGRLLRGVD